MNKNVELLAPVGSMEALYAAVQNGANAVYLGGKLFNARQYASNFDYDELRGAVSYAHLNGVKVYITVNILIDDEEMEEILDYIRFLYEIDIDALIVQDLGLASLVRELFPDLAIHGSTQMTINNLWGAKFLEDMGFTRVVLARETPIEEIKNIKKNSPIELEGFIHGALCVSYSGQCLMSSLIGGRSGNRGRCAQPCRMNYSIVNKEGKLVKDWDKKYILSTRDLNTLDYLEEIIEAGISSLKIEGRMKRPEYVATIVDSYRRAIDKGSQSIDGASRLDMEQIFNREFTKGVGLGDFGKSYISTDRPDNRGIRLGRVTRADKYKVYISLEEDLEKGDGIEFILSNGDYKGIRSPLGGKKGSIIAIEKPGYINNDTLVYRTSSSKLLEKARYSYENHKKTYPIDMEITIRIGEEPRLKICHEDYIISTTIDMKVEKAKNLGLSEERLKEQLEKLGDTVYHLNSFQANLEEGAHLPVSSLNKLRRLGIEKLDLTRKNLNKRKIIEDGEFKLRKGKILEAEKHSQKKEAKIHVKVANLDQFNQLDLDKLDRVYLGFDNNLGEAINRVRAKKKEVFIWTDKILYEENLNNLESLIKPIEDSIDGIAVSNLGSFEFIKEKFDLKIHGDMGLNVFNSYTANYLDFVGLEGISLSPELNLNQIRKIATRTEASLESIVYGYLPVMTTKTCPMALVKGCRDDNDCKTCNFASGYGLKDRMNFVFNMFRGDGYTNIYNSVPIMILDNIDRILDGGISNLRLDFTLEKDGIGEIQSAYYDYLHNLIGENEIEGFIEKFKENTNITNGHYFRGVM